MSLNIGGQRSSNGASPHPQRQDGRSPGSPQEAMKIDLPPLWVKLRRTLGEHKVSALRSNSDIA
jgi:hypothetical protein